MPDNMSAASAAPSSSPSSAPSSTPSASSAPSSTPSSSAATSGAPGTQTQNNSQSPAASAGSTPGQVPGVAEAHKEAIRKLRLKVDQKDVEIPESEAIKLAQLGLASQQRFQQAAQMRKEAESFISMMKDPAKLVEVLRNPAIGVDVRKFAEEYLANELKKEQLTPEQRQIQELQEQLAKKQDEEKKSEETKRQEDFTKLKAHYEQDYTQKIMGVLDTAGLPKSPKTVYRMAEYMSVALDNGVEIEPSDVVNLVRQDYMSEVNDLFGQMPGETLLQILGDGVANKIRKADLARLKAVGGAPLIQDAPQADVAPKAPRPEPTPASPTKYKNIHDWRDEIAKRARS